MSYFSALREFGYAVQVLSAQLVPSVPRKQRRKILNTVLNDLSEDTFMRGMIVNRILKSNMIDMSEEICKEYQDTKTQVYGVLSWLPRMELHRGKLEKQVRKHRKDYGLPL